MLFQKVNHLCTIPSEYRLRWTPAPKRALFYVDEVFLSNALHLALLSSDVSNAIKYDGCPLHGVQFLLCFRSEQIADDLLQPVGSGPVSEVQARPFRIQAGTHSPHANVTTSAVGLVFAAVKVDSIGCFGGSDAAKVVDYRCCGAGRASILRLLPLDMQGEGLVEVF